MPEQSFAGARMLAAMGVHRDLMVAKIFRGFGE